MEELLEKLEQLKLVLDKDKNIVRVKELNKIVKNNKKLMNLVENYNLYHKQEIKNELYDDKLYREYKSLETEINILILSINKELKTITDEGECHI